MFTGLSVRKGFDWKKKYTTLSRERKRVRENSNFKRVEKSKTRNDFGDFFPEPTVKNVRAMAVTTFVRVPDGIRIERVLKHDSH